jgi:hypothetical protein
MMGFLVTIGSLFVASGFAVLAVGMTVFLAASRDARFARSYLKRCALAGLPLLLAFLVMTFAFWGNPCGLPIWPDQDETAQRRVARLAAISFADKTWVVSAVMSIGGLSWFCRTILVQARQAGHGWPGNR